ncbi:MAG: GMC family oxidoreductase, partial [Pseudomonadota bacterium]
KTQHSPGVRNSLSSGVTAAKHLVGAIKDGDLSAFNRHISSMFPVGGELSIALYRAAAKKFNNVFRNHKRFEVFKMNHMTEQEPNPDSRVLLSDNKDPLGMQRVDLDWRLTELDIWTIRRAQQLIHQEAERCGFGVITDGLEDDSIPEKIHGGYHHMGTTRMHDDPRQGVVDKNCKVHGMENLYIAGSPVFTTGGYANPVLTAVALTARLADELKAKAFN